MASVDAAVQYKSVQRSLMRGGPFFQPECWPLLFSVEHPFSSVAVKRMGHTSVLSAEGVHSIDTVVDTMLDRRGSYIFKPNREGCGNGVFVVELNETKTSLTMRANASHRLGPGAGEVAGYLVDCDYEFDYDGQDNLLRFQLLNGDRSTLTAVLQYAQMQRLGEDHYIADPGLVEDVVAPWLYDGKAFETRHWVSKDKIAHYACRIGATAYFSNQTSQTHGTGEAHFGEKTFSPLFETELSDPQDRVTFVEETEAALREGYVHLLERASNLGFQPERDTVVQFDLMWMKQGASFTPFMTEYWITNERHLIGLKH